VTLLLVTPFSGLQLSVFLTLAISKTPHALADGLMLVFQHPVKRRAECGKAFTGMSNSPYAEKSMRDPIVQYNERFSATETN
jgi:hypothetical protein